MPIQRKARISAPGDRFEREADDVADRVTRMAQPSALDSTSRARTVAGHAQALDLVQCAAAENSDTAPDTGLAMRVASQGGSPLPVGLRAYLAAASAATSMTCASTQAPRPTRQRPASSSR
nr:hypothetical protein [Massilia frigida]